MYPCLMGKRARLKSRSERADAPSIPVLDPSTDPRNLPALDAMLVYRDRVADAEAALRDSVAVARGLGHSWREIGLALGVTRQAATARFGASS